MTNLFRNRTRMTWSWHLCRWKFSVVVEELR